VGVAGRLRAAPCSPRCAAGAPAVEAFRSPAGEAVAGLTPCSARPSCASSPAPSQPRPWWSATDVLVVLVALDLLDLGQSGVGYLNAACGVGGLVGGAVGAAVLGRGRLALALSAGCVLMGGCLAGLGAWPGTATAFALIAVLTRVQPATGVPFLAPLALATVENLARRAQSVPRGRGRDRHPRGRRGRSLLRDRRR